jgi:hypothetical protein
METGPIQEPNSTDDVLRTMGFILLAAGLAVFGFVLWNAYLLWMEPQSIGLLRKLAPSGELFAALSDVQHGEVKVSTKFLEYGNIVLAIAILSISAGIGKALVWTGARNLGFRINRIR